MKNLIYIVLCLSVILTDSCSHSLKIYSPEEIQTDSTGVRILRKNGKRVNGIVEQQTTNFLNEAIVRHTKFVDGIGVEIRDYIDDECVGHIEYTNNQISGTYYGKYEDNSYTMSMKDGMADGPCKLFGPNGKQIYEIIFEDGNRIKTYDFDSNGNKIIPIDEQIDLIAYRTGFYERIDARYNEVLYCPIVIMKFKNISDTPIDNSERVKITATFINKDEEWSTDNTYLIGYSDSPLSPGISRQCYVMSSVGYTSYYSINQANISCQLSINDKPFKTIKIANEFRSSNRM